MATMKQGKEYKEEEVDISSSITKKFNIDIKYLIFGGVILVIAIIVIVFFTIDSVTKEKETSNTSEQIESSESDYFEEDPFGDEEDLFAQLDSEEDLFSMFSFTDEQRRELALMGLTAYEIETAMNEMRDFEDVRREQEAQVDIYLKERYKELRDGLLDKNSEDYRILAEYTWLANQERPLGEITEYNNYQTRREINPYEKLPEMGPQLTLRMELDNGDIAFFTISPERWAELPQEENMVVKIEYVTYNGNEYITKIEEVRQD